MLLAISYQSRSAWLLAQYFRDKGDNFAPKGRHVSSVVNWDILQGNAPRDKWSGIIKMVLGIGGMVPQDPAPDASAVHIGQVNADPKLLYWATP